MSERTLSEELRKMREGWQVPLEEFSTWADRAAALEAEAAELRNHRERDCLQMERDALAAENERLREHLRLANMDACNEAAENERLRAERDDALAREAGILRRYDALRARIAEAVKVAADMNDNPGGDIEYGDLSRGYGRILAILAPEGEEL